ncbi:MAG: trigger factor [Planctomycetes bacterium]|nr:trigger factor [Planctomycetota bacterium]
MSIKTPLSIEASDLGACLHKLAITIPAERVSAELDRGYKAYSKGMKMPGFRPGHIPASVLRQQFGDAMIDEVKGDMFQSVINEGLREHKIVAMRLKDFDGSEIEVAFDTELTFEVVIEAFPSVVLPDWPEVAIEAADTKPSDEQRADAVKQVTEGNVQFDDAEGGLEGDLTAECNLTYHYKEDSTDSTDGVKLSLGQALYGSEDAAYDKAMTGAKAGDKVEIPVTFNEGFQNEEWVGKEGMAHVEVVKVVKSRPATMEELVEQFAMKDVDELQARIEESIERENFQRDQDRRLFDSLEKIHELNPFHMPDSMIEEEIAGTKENQKKQMVQQGMPEEEADKQIAASADGKAEAETAERKLRHFFILSEIARVDKIRVTSKDMNQQFQALAAQHGVEVKMLKNFYKEQDMTEGMRSEILEAKTRGHLLALMDQHTKVAAGTSAE